MAFQYKSIRTFIIQLIFIVFLLTFLLRILFLQIFRTDLKLSSENNAITRIINYPARGLILDRNGNILVYNQTVYDLEFTPNLSKEFDTNEICNILGVSKEIFVQKINDAIKYSKFKSSKIFEAVSQEKFYLFSEQLHKYPGFDFQIRYERAYKYSVASHLLGYIGKVDKRIIDTSSYYTMHDYIGKSGIELTYEKYLRGKKGVNYWYVDVKGKRIKPFNNSQSDTPAFVGRNIVCTIDLKLQQYAESLMVNKKGSIVAIEPQTGEILVMVSFPSYNPNMLNISNLELNYPILKNDPQKPLLNRAMQSSMQPPGSTFKTVDAVIALSEGVINTSSVKVCNGGYNTGSNIIGCHHHGVAIDFYRSISGSCNTYYCDVFVKMIHKPGKSFQENYNHWIENVQKFGIAKKLGVDIPDEKRGILITSDQLNSKYTRWNGNTIAPLGIGQNEMGLTTLQMANIASIFANRGYYYIPHAVKSIEEGEIAPKYKKRVYTGFDSIYFSYVVEGMEQAFMHGTAASVFLKDIAQCGKTGTAENPHGDDHSIFIAFAPKDNPKIAIAVYIENAGFGATVAAPIASLIIEKYLRGYITRLWMEQNILNTDIIHRVQKPPKKKNK